MYLIAKCDNMSLPRANLAAFVYMETMELLTLFPLILIINQIVLPLPTLLPKLNKMTKAIITVVGKDTVGIIAHVCSYLAESNINILDINQTIVHGFFNMMMIVDISQSGKTFEAISSELDEAGKEKAVQAKIQLEAIFDKMYRI